MDKETFLGGGVEFGGGAGGRGERWHVGVGTEMLMERIEGRKGTAGISESEVVTRGVALGATNSGFAMRIMYFSHLGKDSAEVMGEIREIRMGHEITDRSKGLAGDMAHDEI